MLGNPPYIRQEELDVALKPYLTAHYQASAGTADLLCVFLRVGPAPAGPGGIEQQFDALVAALYSLSEAEIGLLGG